MLETDFSKDANKPAWKAPEKNPEFCLLVFFGGGLHWRSLPMIGELIISVSNPRKATRFLQFRTYTLGALATSFRIMVVQHILRDVPKCLYGAYMVCPVLEKWRIKWKGTWKLGYLVTQGWSGLRARG